MLLLSRRGIEAAGQEEAWPAPEELGRLNDSTFKVYLGWLETRVTR